MRLDFDKFRGRKVPIAVIAPHDSLRVKTFWEEEGLPFIGIPDPDGNLGKLYGQEWNPLKLGRMPALFIVDQQGKIAFAHYGKNMADIPADEDILNIIESLEKRIVKGRS